jgi:hypothetical protein
MNMQDLKTVAITLGGFGVTLTNVEQWLKITLLIVSVAYTVLRMIKMKSTNKED